MKILHKCGHTQNWNPPEWMVRHYKEKMLRYKEWLENGICIDCEQKRTGEMIN